MRAAWALLLGAVCSCHGPSSPVAMDPLDFGVVRADVAAHGHTTLRNLGPRDVTLTTFTFTQGRFSGPFDASGLASGRVVVPAQGFVTVAFDYTPDSASAVDHADLTARSDEGGEASVVGTLTGRGGTSALTATTAIALGDVPINMEAKQALTLTNSGTVPATIRSIQFQPPSPLEVSTHFGQFTMKAGETTTVPFRVNVRAEGPLTGSFEVTTDIPEQPALVVPVTARGLAARFTVCRTVQNLPQCNPSTPWTAGRLETAVNLGAFSGSTPAAQEHLHVSAIGNVDTAISVQVTGFPQGSASCGLASNFDVKITGPDGAAVTGSEPVVLPLQGNGLDVDVTYAPSHRCTSDPTDRLGVTFGKVDSLGNDPETVAVTFTAHAQ
jgi:hypothetical protein